MANRSSKKSSNRNHAKKQTGKPVDQVKNFPIWLYAVAGILVAAMVVGLAAFLPSMNGGIRGVREYRNLERGHTTLEVTYDPIPPVGGKHNELPQNCGVYTEPIQNENAVHSLEHGAVWITYQPDLPADEVQALQTLTRASGYRLLSPYPGIDSPIIVSAWGYQLILKKADDSRLIKFLQKYEQSPLSPEPGALCNGGVGEPQ